MSATPAHRGIAYAVFEDMQLADYGNRIPSLTFEVRGDGEAASLSAIVGTLSGGALVMESGETIGGFAAAGDSVRGALEALAAVYPMPLCDDGAVLRVGAEETIALDPAGYGARAAEGEAAPDQEVRRPADTMPTGVAITYYEPSRDYQAGMQQARRESSGLRAERIELPAALPAEEAKRLAEETLRRAWIGRARRTVRLPWRAMAVRAGQRVMLDGAAWRVAGWRLETMVLTLELEREEAAPLVPAVVTPGRHIGSADGAAGTTILHLLDLPSIDDRPGDAPVLWVAAAGSGRGWRRAELAYSLDEGASWQPVGRTAMPAVMGAALEALGPGSTWLFDRMSAVEIELVHDGMALAGASDDALLAGANLALFGDELIQFGSAEQIAPRRWRVGRLLRGRRGSEWAVGPHAPGDRFVLLDRVRLAPIELPIAALGAALRVRALGPGDGGVAVEAVAAVIAHGLRPPAPVRIAARRLDDGTIRFGWTRRSRAGWSWIDGGDAPLGEDREAYRLAISSGGAVVRTVETSAPAHDYSAADQAADGLAAAPAAVAITIAQIGTRAPSLPPAVANWTL